MIIAVTVEQPLNISRFVSLRAQILIYPLWNNIIVHLSQTENLARSGENRNLIKSFKITLWKMVRLLTPYFCSLPWFWGILKGRDHFSRNTVFNHCLLQESPWKYIIRPSPRDTRSFRAPPSLMPCSLPDSFVSEFTLPLCLTAIARFFFICQMLNSWSLILYSLLTWSALTLLTTYPNTLGPTSVLIFSVQFFWPLQLKCLFIFRIPSWYYLLAPNHMQSCDHTCFSLSGSVS